MTVSEARKSVATQIEKQKSTTAKELHSETQIPYVMIYAAIKHFNDGGGIEVEVKDDAKLYKLLDAKKLRALASGETPNKSSKAQEKEEDITTSPMMKKYANVPTRDTSKFIVRNIDKEPRGKGRTVLAIIQTHVKAKRMTLDKLKATFPDELVQKWGVTTSWNKAKEHDRQRYFVGENDQILTSDKPQKKLAVTNQWSLQRWEKFAEIARGLGYKIQKA